MNLCIILKLLFLVFFFNVSYSIASNSTPPTPLKTLDGERFENRTLRLLPNGEIIYTDSRRSIIDKNGVVHSALRTNVYDRNRNYTGFRLQILKNSDIIAERFYSKNYFLFNLIIALKENNIVVLAFMRETRQKGSRYFTLVMDSHSVKEREDIPWGSEFVWTKHGYYMLAVSSSKLLLYSFDSKFNVLKSYTIDTHVAFSPHIAVDSIGQPHIIYYNPKENCLKYARMEQGKPATYSLEKPESGIASAIDIDSTDVLIASYYYLNPYNKGIILYRIPVHSANPLQSMKRCIFDRRKYENIGWSPSLSSNEKYIAISFYNKTKNKTEVYLIKKEYIDSSNDFYPDWLKTWMEYKKELNLFNEWGYNYIMWGTDVSTKFEDLQGVTIPAGKYKLEPTLVEEFGLGGEYRKTSFAFNYMKNMIVDKAKARDQSIGKVVEYIAGSISVEDVFGYGRSLELHTRNGLLKGEYSQENITHNFTTRYLDIDLDVFDKKGGYFYGLSYRNYKTPQPVVISQNLSVIEQYVTEVNFNIYSLLVGYSNLNYLRKYENKYKGFYIDGKFHLGISTLGLERKPSTVSVSFPIAAFTSLNLEPGFLIFKRIESLRYLSLFLKIGIIFDGSLIWSGETKESVENDTKNGSNPEPEINIDRADYFLGGVIKAGITF